jgi:predicted transcriptional regulator
MRIGVGETLDEMGARAIDAWHRMEHGEAVHERHVGFETWETMVRVLTPKRLELLRVELAETAMACRCS